MQKLDRSTLTPGQLQILDDFFTRRRKFGAFLAERKIPLVTCPGFKNEWEKSIPRNGGPQTENLNYLKELMTTGQLIAVTDKRFALQQVPEAHHYVESGNKTGNVVLNINHSSNL